MKIFLTLLIVLLLEPVLFLHKLVRKGKALMNKLDQSRNAERYSLEEQFSFFDSHQVHNN